MATEVRGPGSGSVNQSRSWLERHTTCRPPGDSPRRRHFLNVHFANVESEAQTVGESLGVSGASAHAQNCLPGHCQAGPLQGEVIQSQKSC